MNIIRAIFFSDKKLIVAFAEVSLMAQMLKESLGSPFQKVRVGGPLPSAVDSAVPNSEQDSDVKNCSLLWELSSFLMLKRCISKCASGNILSFVLLKLLNTSHIALVLCRNFFCNPIRTLEMWMDEWIISAQNRSRPHVYFPGKNGCKIHYGRGNSQISESNFFLVWHLHMFHLLVLSSPAYKTLWNVISTYAHFYC